MSTTMRGRKMTTRMPELATFRLERDYRLDVRRSSNIAAKIAKKYVKK